MRAFGILLVVGVLAGCGYDPPPQTDVSKPAYRTDLDACQDSAATEVNKENAKKGLRWFASPVRRWGQIDDAVDACMAGKGYGRLRACSDAELRSGNVVVTASGVRCGDAPSPERRRPG
ncbi:MAG TPA: hypothetical protein VE650_05705 [Acetobacteraceae bacterium]|nr:hypothetical protein [Acetobacteraceae bacterium]